MLQLSLTVDHAEHGRHTVTAGPPEIIRWEKWAARPITSAFVSTGPGDEDVDLNIGMGDMAFMAYAALKRTGEAGKLPPFEVWCDGLTDLDMEDEDPDPTGAGPSATP